MKDLRYRFGACAIGIPGLRERRAEIPVLAQRALERCQAHTGLEGPARFSEAGLALLCEGEYSGNVRQLEGIVLCAYVVARDQGAEQIDVNHLSVELKSRLQYKRRGDREENRMVIESVLKITGGNVKRAALFLGVSRNTVNTARRSSSRR